MDELTSKALREGYNAIVESQYDGMTGVRQPARWDSNYTALDESAFADKIKRAGKTALATGMVAAAPFITGCAGNQYSTHHPRTIEEIDAEIAKLKAQMAERESPCSRNTPEYQAAKYDYIMNGDRSGLDAYAARCNHGSRNTPEYRAAMNDWVMNGDISGLH